ncbi:hypothetical protein BAG01nite_31120 [Brevibacillus agri]|uniref:YrzI family small protein n=1 Tax=Brevibacillus agri TaxID=51101 RepID=A0ABQ0SUJ6_9BACL|nr:MULTISPECIES: hypothetical protein [Brevibacillus]ELK43494.1 hypothetical protein D478_03182 [Brevibacillus agri BAB-2500]EJL47337.1 hypothetical protein PMI08_00455 [Brevibacillus sp. CF112]MBY0053639.1 hypothetical protein [Brevibacillus agri]MCG5252986.1 hypothetical protein [Brevibacillus agri]MDN4094228.1 hypothetical protein [Brevibacillus agri]
MVLNFLLFTVKIERKQVKPEERMAAYARARYLEERAEAHAFEAAQFVSRI